MSYPGVLLTAQVLGFWTAMEMSRYYPKTFLRAQSLFLI
jgi:hypothetical protein